MWLLDVAAKDAVDADVTLRFASGPYIDGSKNYYDLRLVQPALYQTKAFGLVVPGADRSSVGFAELVNADGGLDYLADYAVDGRAVTMKLLDEDGSITTVFNGTAESLDWESTKLRLKLRDPQQSFADAHPYNVFAGNNALPLGVEGVSTDIKGKRKPRCYGKCRHVPPVIVNTSKLIYQVSDLSTATVAAVYDRGVALTPGSAYSSISDMETNAPTAGQFRAYQGYFRVGTTPSGQVTADVNDSVFLLGAVANKIVVEAGKTMDSSDTTAMNAVGEVGIFVNDTRNTSAMLDLLANSAGGYWFFDATGIVRMKQLLAPTSPTIVLHDYEGIDISRRALGAGKNGLPIYKVRMLADRVEQTLNQTDLAAIIASDPVTVARLSQQFREAVKETTATLTRHPLSSELEIETALRSLTDAQTQADRLGALLAVRRDLVQYKGRLDPTTAASIAIGTVVTVDSYRLGYGAGRDFVVIGYTLDARTSKATLDLWG